YICVLAPYDTSLSFTYFSFYCSRDHRDLHSFPTRRSSDLHGLPGTTRPSSPGTTPTIRAPCSKSAIRPPFSIALAAAICWPVPRSEEHTSELQSRSDLVCRLLLEKKKKIQQYITHIHDTR